MKNLPDIKAEFKSFVVELGNQSMPITLPETGTFVEESHYVTIQDRFLLGKYPKLKQQKIVQHLERSLEIYKEYTDSSLESLYHESHQREWTPAEGGKKGQGSVGDLQLKKLTPEMEMWLLTMMWAQGEKPAPGTKFLLTYNNRHAVVVAGFETGPGSSKFLGGVTPEVHAWLGSDNDTELLLRYLEDQSVPVGPVNLAAESGTKIASKRSKHNS